MMVRPVLKRHLKNMKVEAKALRKQEKEMHQKLKALDVAIADTKASLKALGDK